MMAPDCAMLLIRLLTPNFLIVSDEQNKNTNRMIMNQPAGCTKSARAGGEPEADVRVATTTTTALAANRNNIPTWVQPEIARLETIITAYQMESVAAKEEHEILARENQALQDDKKSTEQVFMKQLRWQLQKNEDLTTQLKAANKSLDEQQIIPRQQQWTALQSENDALRAAMLAIEHGLAIVRRQQQCTTTTTGGLTETKENDKPFYG
jgi:hypothetical protein